MLGVTATASRDEANPDIELPDLTVEPTPSLLSCAGQEEKASARFQTCLSRYSMAGLRTMVYSFRQIDEAEFSAWILRYREASNSLGDRESLLASLAEQIESSMELLGCTAIEDRLQDEVPQTLAKLRDKAGIAVWMLTGDKRETAANIAACAGLIETGFSPQSEFSESPQTNTNKDDSATKSATKCPTTIIHIEGESEEQIESQLRRVIQHYLPQIPSVPNTSSKPPVSPLAAVDYVIVIDGKSLKYALKSQENVSLFLTVASHARSGICCRVSPLQKSLIVKLMKRTKLAPSQQSHGDNQDEKNGS